MKIPETFRTDLAERQYANGCAKCKFGRVGPDLLYVDTILYEQLYLHHIGYIEYCDCIAGRGLRKHLGREHKRLMEATFTIGGVELSGGDMILAQVQRAYIAHHERNDPFKASEKKNEETV